MCIRDRHRVISKTEKPHRGCDRGCGSTSRKALKSTNLSTLTSYKNHSRSTWYLATMLKIQEDRCKFHCPLPYPRGTAKNAIPYINHKKNGLSAMHRSILHFSGLQFLPRIWNGRANALRTIPGMFLFFTRYSLVTFSSLWMFGSVIVRQGRGSEATEGVFCL